MLKILLHFPQNTTVNSATTQPAMNGLRNGKKYQKKASALSKDDTSILAFLKKKKQTTAHKQKNPPTFKNVWQK